MEKTAWRFVSSAAVLINSFPSFTFVLVPAYLQVLPVSAQIGTLAVFAALSYFVARLIIAVTDLLHYETVGVSAALVELPPDRRKNAIDIPELTGNSLGGGCWNNTLFLAVTYLCLMVLTDIGLLSNDVLMDVVLLPNWAVVGTLCVVFTILNCFSAQQLSVLHVSAALCRLVFCVFADIGEMKEELEPILMLLVCLVLLPCYLYQMQLPTVLANSQFKAKTQSRLQLVVVALVTVGLLLLSSKPFPAGKVTADSVFAALLIVSSVVSAQLYWRTLASIFVQWHFGLHYSAAVQRHPKTVCFLELFSHWPFYAFYIVSMTVFSDEFNQGRIVRIVLVLPPATMILYALLCSAYEKKLVEWTGRTPTRYKHSAAPLWFVCIMKWLLVTLALLCLALAVQVIFVLPRLMGGVVLQSGLAFLLLLLMIVWKVLR